MKALLCVGYFTRVMGLHFRFLIGANYLAYGVRRRWVTEVGVVVVVVMVVLHAARGRVLMRSCVRRHRIVPARIFGSKKEPRYLMEQKREIGDTRRETTSNIAIGQEDTNLKLIKFVERSSVDLLMKNAYTTLKANEI